MEVVLGVSMAPETVRMVLVEGAAAGGVTVDQDGFDVVGDPTPAAAADHVVAAILGTRDSAAQGGYQLKSSGVSWTDPAEAAALRDVLAARRIENVMLVSAVMAAAALAQAMGSATNWARTALLLVEPTSATLAVVDTSNGTVTDVHRHPLPGRDDVALAKLTAMVSGAESMRARPDGLFLVGSDVDIPLIKPTLEAATSLSVTTPEEPEMALARGASLAAANARLGAPRTITMPSARISSTEAAGSAHKPDARAARSRERHSRKPAATVALVMTIFVTGFVALALALLFGRDPGTDQPPEVSTNVVAPQAPSPPNTGPLPPSAPAPAPPEAPTPEAPQAPAPSPPQSGDHPHWDDWLHRHLGPDFPVP
ncbi:hypothetical protein LTS63_19035 [Mycobacterium intracellulare]|uniref:DUF7159 family protein n=1 Tax=Mycobacterium intracellulare TaxID=1767 RepID=UPI001E5113F0|nr:hypothetical protein [Mycobacterium intracellulare]UGU01003.1 hypothetical protein LTS63_19035 [Mycobacterium intracellulare]